MYTTPGQSMPLPHLNVPPELNQWIPYVVDTAINDIKNRANQNQLRNQCAQVLSNNGFKNNDFNELVITILNFAKQQCGLSALNQSVVDNCILQVNTLMVGVIHNRYYPHQPLGPNEAHQVRQMVQDYQAIQASVGAQNVPVPPRYAPQPPRVASSPAWANTNSNNLPPTPPNSEWHQPAQNTAAAWRAGPNTPTTNVPEPTPQKPAESEWVPINNVDEEFTPSILMPVITAHNPRNQKSTVLRKGNEFKQEITPVNYDQHALTTPFMDARYQQTKVDMEQELGYEVSDQDARDTIVRIKPTPTEFNEVYRYERDIFGMGLEHALWRLSAIIATRAFRDMVNNTQAPEVIDFKYCDVPKIFYQKPDDEKFISLVANAKSYSEIVNILREYSINPNISVSNWNVIHDSMTEEVNSVLELQLNIGANIASITEDWDELCELVQNVYGDTYFGALISKRNYAGNKALMLGNTDIAEAMIEYLNLTEDDMLNKGEKNLKDVLCPIYSISHIVGIDVASHDLEFKLEVGTHRMITYQVSNKIRSLVEEMYRDEKSPIINKRYIITSDNVVFEVRKGIVDESQVILKRIQ